MNKRNPVTFIKYLYMHCLRNDISSRSAEISFYFLMSLFPFIIFLIALVSYLPDISLNKYIDYLSKLMPSSAFEIVNYTIQKAISSRSAKLQLISFFIMLWSASRGVISLIKAINTAYGREENRSFWKLTTVSFVFTIELVLLIILSLILVVFGGILGNFLFRLLGLDDLFLTVWNGARFVIALLTMVFIFISLYLYTPNLRLRVKQALPGAVFSTLGWVVTSLAFSYYANNFANYTAIYGSLGGIIALLTWLFLSSHVMLIGAEINALLYPSTPRDK